jgi:catecholate siderophore receptor
MVATGLDARRASRFAAEFPDNSAEGTRRASAPGWLVRHASMLGTAVSLASLMVASAASAQEGGVALPTIDVTTGADSGYQATQQTITRLPTPLLDTPQTVNVVPQQVIQEQRAGTMEEALRNVVGITFSAGEGGQQGDSPIIRGFAARGDVFRDGFRDPGWYTRDLFSIDRVEVYKGPSAFAFGRGSTGGAINNASKLPTGATFIESTVSGTTGPGIRADLDSGGKVGNVSGRIAATAQNIDTPTRDSVYTKRWGIAPSMSLQLDDATKATLSYVYQGEEGSQDYGQPYLPQPAYSAATGALTNPGYNGNGSAVTPVPVSRKLWYGIEDGPFRDLTTTNTHIVTATIERRLGDAFKLTNGTRYISNVRDSTVTAPRALGDVNNTVFANGTSGGIASAGYPVDLMTVGRERRNRVTDASYLVNQTDLTGKFETGILKHTFATGVEFSRETRAQTRVDLCSQTAAVCRTSLTNPGANTVATDRYDITAPNHTTSNHVALYVSDQIKITRFFELLISLRNDRFSTNYVDEAATGASRELSRTDNMFSQRYGVVFHPVSNASIYLAYGNSYNPSAELGTLSSSANNAASVTLEPEKNVSYEAGAKYEALGGRLTLSGAVFRIEKTNLRIPNDPSAPTAQQFIVLDGLARVEGIELGVAGRLTDAWQVFAGYSYLKSEIAKTTNLAELGRWLPNTPEHNFSLWTTYDVTQRLTVGGGATYQSMAYVNTTNTAYVPEYWKFDAMASFKVDKHSTIQLNVYNITNEEYYSQYYGGHAVPASGRWAMLSWRMRFEPPTLLP